MANIQTLNFPDALKNLYERQLLARGLPSLQHGRWGRQATWKGYKTYELRKYGSLPLVSSSLTEGVTPDETTQMAATKIEMTPALYGAWLGYTDLQEMQSYDPLVGEAVELLGEQAGLSFDTLLRSTLIAGATADYAGTATARSEIDATNDKITFSDWILNYAALEVANARPVQGNKYVCIMHPYTWATLMQDPFFVTMLTRESASAYRNAAMGSVLNCDIYVSSNAATSASTVTVYHMLFIGWQSYGMAGFTGLVPNYNEGAGLGEYSNRTGEKHAPVRIIMKALGDSDFDPLEQRGTIAWKASHVAAVLNPDWLRNLEHATVAS